MSWHNSTQAQRFSYNLGLSGLPNANAKSELFSYTISQIATPSPLVALNLKSQLDMLRFGTQSTTSHWPLSFSAPKSQRFKSQRLQDANATKSQAPAFYRSQRFSATRISDQQESGPRWSSDVPFSLSLCSKQYQPHPHTARAPEPLSPPSFSDRLVPSSTLNKPPTPMRPKLILSTCRKRGRQKGVGHSQFFWSVFANLFLAFGRLFASPLLPTPFCGKVILLLLLPVPCPGMD